MIDFTDCPVDKYKGYDGGNGAKLPIWYENAPYMLKFNPHTPGRKEYKNTSVGEYLGCHIFGSVGIPAQETLLGTYRKPSGTTERVVACKDFNTDGWQLLEFARLKNRCIDGLSSGYGTELESILETIDSQEMIDPVLLKEFFWDMFIVDALIGNFDRHNGNWGLLIRRATDEVRPAPVYDCGSSLYPQLPARRMQEILVDPAELELRIYTFPTSAIKLDGKKINYFDYISSLQNDDCTAALQRITPRIDMSAICRIIEETPGLSPVEQEFYETILRLRKEQILDHSLCKVAQK